MPIMTLWNAGNSLVLTIPKNIAAEHRLTKGSLIRIERSSSGCIRLRPVDRPVGALSRSPFKDRQRRRSPSR